MDKLLGNDNKAFKWKNERCAVMWLKALCEGRPPLTGGCPHEWASNAESVSLLVGKPDAAFRYFSLSS